MRKLVHLRWHNDIYEVTDSGELLFLQRTPQRKYMLQYLVGFEEVEAGVILNTGYIKLVARFITTFGSPESLRFRHDSFHKDNSF